MLKDLVVWVVVGTEMKLLRGGDWTKRLFFNDNQGTS